MSFIQWSAAYVLIGVVAVSAACGPASTPVSTPSEKPAEEQPKYGGILTKWLGGDPPHFDNHQSNTYMTNDPFHPAFNTLIRFNPNDPQAAEIEPSLAERWELSPNGKTYTFYIRKGVKFHEGGTFDAHDAKFNIERMKDPPKGMVSPRRGSFKPIERLEVPDDYTLKVVLERPYPSLLPNLAHGWMVMYDKQWVEAGHDPAKEVNGTGPFKLKEYIRGTSIEVVKNPDYWKKGFPYLDGAKWFIVPDRGTATAAFRTGRLDARNIGLNAEDAEMLTKELGDKIIITDTFDWGGTFVNISVLHKPFDDIRVRQALSLGIDRDVAIKLISHGQSYVQGFMGQKGPWALPKGELVKLPGYGPDIEASRAQAKKLLADAGFPSGLKAKLGVRQTAGAETPAIFLKDQWGKIGVDVTLDTQETAAAYTNMEKGNFDIFVWGTSGTLEDPDAVFSEHFLCGAPRNYSQLCVKEVDALFEKQSRETDIQKRKQLVNEMEKLAITNVHKIILVGNQGRWGMWSYVRGYTPQPSQYNNSHLEGVWLAK